MWSSSARSLRIFVSRQTLLLAATVAVLFFVLPVGGHEGVQHGAGEEIHPRMMVVKTGQGEQFRVTFAQLPPRPVSGERVQFLIRLEEDFEDADPLLGGRLPLRPSSLDVSLELDGRPGRTLIEPQAAEEAGVFRFEHRFPKVGTWSIKLAFQDAGGQAGEAVWQLQTLTPPTRWSLHILQVGIALAGIGLILFLLFQQGGSRQILAATVCAVLTVGSFLLLDQVWPSNVTDIASVLEAGALNAVDQTEEEPASLVQEPPLLPDARLITGVVQYASDRIARVLCPFPATINYPDRVPRVGDRVQAGQVLATIDNRFNTHDYVHLFPQRWELLRENLTLKEAAVEAENDFLRAAQLFELGKISKRQLEQKELHFNQASLEATQAEEQLELHDRQIRRSAIRKTPVESPIRGYITQASYASGQMIYEGDLMFEIVDLSKVWFEAYVRAEDLPLLREAPQVRLVSAAFPDREFSGRLINVRPNMEVESQLIRVLYSVDNSDLWLKSGMSLHLILDDQAAVN